MNMTEESVLSDEVWAAWHAGQEPPRTMRDWDAWGIVSDAACRTAVEVACESCLEILMKEWNELIRQRRSIQRRITMLQQVIATIQYKGPGWERAFSEYQERKEW
jgi:hypothetical protein